MHAIAWRTFCATQRVSQRKACRIIAGVRHPFPTARKFHRSAILYQVPETPSTGTPVDTQGKDNERNESAEVAAGTEAEPETAVTDGDHPERTRRKRSMTDYGSAVNRSNRNRRSTGVPTVNLPPWLSEHNITLALEYPPGDVRGDVMRPLKRAWHELGAIRRSEGWTGKLEDIWFDSNQVLVIKDEATGDPVPVKTEHLEWLKQKLPALSDSFSKPEDGEKETVSFDSLNALMPGLEESQKQELEATIKAELVLRAPSNADVKDLHRPTTIFLYPKDGGLSSLNHLVQSATAILKADYMFLGPDDIAEIVGGYLGENIAWSSKRDTALIGYDSQYIAGRMETIQNDVEDMGVKANEEDEDDQEKPPYRPSKPLSVSLSPLFKKLSPLIGSLGPIFSALNSKSGSASATITESPVPGQSSFQFSPQQALSLGIRTASGTDERWLELKINTVLETMLDSVSKKREESLNFSTDDPSQYLDACSLESSGLVVHISEYNEIISTVAGSALMSKLEDIVKKRWHGGEKITLVGTSCSANQIPDFSKADIQDIQSRSPNAKHRTIVTTPDKSCDVDFFDEKERQYIRKINARHIREMVIQLTGIPADQIPSDFDIEYSTLNSTEISEVEDAVWQQHKVHRIATTMIGLTSLEPDNKLDSSTLTKAFKIMSSSDEAKYTWASEERKRLEEEEKAEATKGEKKEAPVSAKKAAEDRIKQLKEKCNFHEKKLLNGVIYPDDIKVSFSDVRTPPETIEALKTLTSLSLIRPEAFTYGVLATDKIPGLLLYGPPGTGKTMLAKAVAKESGATVLDVSGADLFNLYVGEGEKNVRALFSLAKKLTPCVVFIDEADAIFGSRSGDSSKRTSHRELINQFLREWDGMKDMSAFIMVATNRPFDLDDAVLRRLPRRLLIDLPTENDREAILKIHLANEVLDDSVSLKTIAKETPFYSGSDLKNVSVAAALACVREENEEAAKHTGEEPYVYPPLRTLTKRHFDKAMEEISASISEDMSTLKAVRKFDEKYGDRKGRRKKKAALGFGGLPETDKDSEAGRVRKIQEL